MVPRLLGTKLVLNLVRVAWCRLLMSSAARNVNAAGQEHKHHYSCRLAITDKHTP